MRIRPPHPEQLIPGKSSPFVALRFRLFIATFLVLCHTPLPVRAVIPPPTEDQFNLSLNGTWRFKLEQDPPPSRVVGVKGRPISEEAPATLEPFFKTDYREDKTWRPLSVPGNWEMAGYSPATYNQPDNASGLYRLEFKVPSKWNGRVVKINFDGVQNGCEIWCNGQPVPVASSSWGRTNYHEGGWTAWQADLTAAIKFGKPNLLALRVTKNTRSVDCDSGDFFLLGGVHRPVTLFSVPVNHIRDLTVQTELQPDGHALVKVIAELGAEAKGSKILMSLEGMPEVEGAVAENGLATLTQTVSRPKLWSAEFPNLYALAVKLKSSEGRVLEQVARKVGIRQVAIKKGIFCVNDVPVKLVGICRHDVYPTLGTAITPEIWKKDLLLMKAANFNAIRTSHYPYGSGFYDLCDQLGFYVLDEEPFCWVNCDDPKLTEAFEQRARETVGRDKNHPCVVIWGVGNENKPGRNNALAAKITRELDPTRPRLISCQRADQGTVGVEFDDAHYVTPQQIHNAENDKRRSKWPMIYTENPNVWDVRNGPDYGSLDLWAAVINRTWKEVWQDEHVTGTFLWEWQDRAVADKSPTKYYSYFPETGINLLKVKGVVDGFRNPRPEYYHIKMAQSPVSIGEKIQVDGRQVTVEVTNRYSFTDLSTLSVKWSLKKETEVLSQGITKLALAARSHGRLRLELPATSEQAETLALEFNHPAGWNVVSYQFALGAARPGKTPVVHDGGKVMFPSFNLVTGALVKDPKGWKHLDSARATLAQIKLQKANGQVSTINSGDLLNLELKEVGSVDADIILDTTTNAVGHVHAEFFDANFSYRISWAGKKSDSYELGWIFDCPKGCDRFSWDRQALWSYYPPDHIGRPHGTARPDSARVALTKVSRPDAFDFSSTKFDCNWASLTDSRNNGICLSFAPGHRHHVRGGFDSKGNCTLMVNRSCSPPHDISSHVVPDLYTELKAGTSLEGSFRINKAGN
jgi:beta-galactosidase